MKLLFIILFFNLGLTQCSYDIGDINNISLNARKCIKAHSNTLIRTKMREVRRSGWCGGPLKKIKDRNRDL